MTETITWVMYSNKNVKDRFKRDLSLAIIIIPLVYLIYKAFEYFGFEVYKGIF